MAIDLEPEVERGLMARAQAKGLSLVDYAHEVLERDAEPENLDAERTGQDLIDAGARVRGLLTDKEVDRIFSRTFASSRPVDFS